LPPPPPLFFTPPLFLYGFFPPPPPPPPVRCLSARAFVSRHLGHVVRQSPSHCLVKLQDGGGAASCPARAAQHASAMSTRSTGHAMEPYLCCGAGCSSRTANCCPALGFRVEGVGFRVQGVWMLHGRQNERRHPCPTDACCLMRLAPFTPLVRLGRHRVGGQPPLSAIEFLKFLL